MDVHFQNFHERRDKRTKGPCRYYNQTGGCKKGDQYDFDHQRGTVIKVPKVCKIGQVCTWKPCCKFVHLEDGDQMPDPRNREMRTPERKLNQTPRTSPRSSLQNQTNLMSQNLNFQQLEISQPPRGVGQKSVEIRRKWLRPPSLESMNHFPNLLRKQGRQK